MLKIEFDDNFVVESMGTIEQYVYDIEVDNDHNFFANNILVHNSCYVTFSNLVTLYKDRFKNTSQIIDFLDKLSDQKIQPFLEKTFIDLQQYTNCLTNKIFMKRELICEKILAKAKKRYCFLVWDKEKLRYKTPEVKITGLESDKSDIPEYCRKAIYEMCVYAVTKNRDDILNYVDQFKKDFYKQPPHIIATPKTVNLLTKYASHDTIYSKGTPMQVRASLLYNHYIKEMKLDSKYQYIRGGDSIRFVQLVLPNPIHESVIGFHDELPVEFGLHDYIDYEYQYQKCFYKPVRDILQAGKIVQQDINEATLDEFLI